MMLGEIFFFFFCINKLFGNDLPITASRTSISEISENRENVLIQWATDSEKEIHNLSSNLIFTRAEFPKNGLYELKTHKLIKEYFGTTFPSGTYPLNNNVYSFALVGKRHNQYFTNV